MTEPTAFPGLVSRAGFPGNETRAISVFLSRENSPSPRNQKRCSVRAAALPVLLLATACGRGPALITVDPGTRYQTIVGWEAAAEAGQIEVPGFEIFQDTLFDLAVFEVGINRVRLQMYSNFENRRDWFAERLAGTLDTGTWRCNRFSTQDDNGDPYEIDWDGFRFSQLDDTMERVVLPLARRLESRGEKLYINALYNASLKQCPDAPYHHHENPEEYAEFALAVHLHMQGRWGILPDAWEVLLEPENTRWSAQQMGDALVAAGKRLEENGFTPDFIAPSNANMATALAFWDTIIAVPGARRFLKEFSYHRYGGVSASNLERVGAIARAQGVRTAILEHIGSGHDDLHADLEIGRNSAWQQFALAYRGRGGRGGRGGAYLAIDPDDETRRTVTLGSRTKFLRQYFFFVRKGATRIGATTSRAAFAPLAFVNTDGTHVVVIKADRAGEFTVRGLPAGSYGITSTTEARYAVDLEDVRIGPGGTVTAGIPAAGVLTIHGRR